MNPLALGLVVLGGLLIVLGLLLVSKHKITGIAISLVGLVTAVAPFLITLLLF